jgi:hypothetical protein
MVFLEKTEDGTLKQTEDSKERAHKQYMKTHLNIYLYILCSL